MAKQITKDKIIEINELYLEIKTYAGVSRKMGGSPAPATVKKYIIPDYISQKNLKVKKFSKEDIPKQLSAEAFLNVDNYGELCILTEEEREEIRELWKEILI